MCWDYDDPWGYDDPSYYDDDPDPWCCDHEDSEIDLLTGCASCYRCGESWFASDGAIRAEHERIAAYYEWQAEQERPWNRFKEWAGNQLRGLKIRLPYGVKICWPRRQVAPSEMTDEIPF